MRRVLIYRLRVCWRLLWFSVILTMLVLCGLVVFHLRPEKSAHNTRSDRFACYIPNVKSFGIKSFFFTGSKLWNSLSYNIQCITDKSIFKKMIKGTLWNRLRSVHFSDYIFY